MGRKARMNYHKRMRFRTKLIIVCFVLLIGFCILRFGFSLQKIEIVGGTYYTEEELKDYFVTSGLDKNTIFLYLRLRFRKDIDIPFVQKYDYDLVDNHTIKIQVYEKTLTGCIQYMNEYMYFDKDGYILDISNEKMENVPLISGVQFSQMALFDKLAVEDNKIFATIMDISQLISKYKLTIDRVVFDAAQHVSLYTGNIKVLLGKKNTYDEQIAELSRVLPEAKDLKGEFDLQEYTKGENIIFNKKE